MNIMFFFGKRKKTPKAFGTAATSERGLYEHTITRKQSADLQQAIRKALLNMERRDNQRAVDETINNALTELRARYVSRLGEFTVSYLWSHRNNPYA